MKDPAILYLVDSKHWLRDAHTSIPVHYHTDKMVILPDIATETCFFITKS